VERLYDGQATVVAPDGESYLATARVEGVRSTRSLTERRETTPSQVAVWTGQLHVSDMRDEEALFALAEAKTPVALWLPDGRQVTILLLDSGAFEGIGLWPTSP